MERARGSSASSSPEPQTKLRLSGHNRLATERATTETTDFPFSFSNCATFFDGECWL